MKSIQLKTSFPTVWADLAYQNQILKGFSLGALVVTVLSLCLTLILVARKPIIIPLDAQAEVVPLSASTPIEQAADQAARAYLKYRYSWEPSNLGAHLLYAKNFIAPGSQSAFEKTTADLARFSKEKNVSERVYPTSVVVNAERAEVSLTADRFNEIQGLKAASVLRVVLNFQTGPRTTANPWGIYIVKENELQ